MTQLRPGRLPIIVDTPSETPGLGFGSYAEGIAAAALDGAPARYTIGLYGPWGTGKSSLLQSVKTALGELSKDARRPTPIIVDFDAWRYGKEINLLLPLLAQVQFQLKGDDPWFVRMRERIGGTLRNLEFSASIPLAEVRIAQGSNSEAKYVNPFSDLIGIGEGFRSGGNRRVVVLIDDLDRCTPDTIVGMLEAIHLLTDVDGFVFVLALDYEYLISALEHRYPTADAQKFIEKIVQIPFHIPQPVITSTTLAEIIDAWTDLRADWFQGVEDETLQAIAQKALRSNPRQVKRLLNSYMLTRFMKWDETSGYGAPDRPRLLARTIGLQLAWPTLFGHLHREILDQLSDLDGGSTKGVSMTTIEAFTSQTDYDARKRLSGSSKEDVHAQIRDYLDTSFVEPDDDWALVGQLMDLTSDVVAEATEPGNMPVKESSPNPLTAQLQPAATPQPSFTAESSSDVFETLRAYALGLSAATVAHSRATYHVVRLETEGRKVLFVTFFVKAGRVDVQLPLDPEPYLKPEHEGVVIDQRNITHPGVGDLLLRVRPDDPESSALAEELIERSLRTRAAEAHVTVPSPGRD